MSHKKYKIVSRNRCSNEADGRSSRQKHWSSYCNSILYMQKIRGKIKAGVKLTPISLWEPIVK